MHYRLRVSCMMSLPHPAYMRLMNPNAKKGEEPQVVRTGQIVMKRVVQFVTL